MKNFRHQAAASWIFGFLFVGFLVAVFFFADENTAAWKLPILQFVAALLAGLFGFFLSGNVQLEGEQDVAGRKVKIQATGGFALFLVVFLGWDSLGSAVQDSERTKESVDEDRIPRVEEGPRRDMKLQDESAVMDSKVAESTHAEAQSWSKLNFVAVEWIAARDAWLLVTDRGALYEVDVDLANFRACGRIERPSGKVVVASDAQFKWVVAVIERLIQGEKQHRILISKDAGESWQALDFQYRVSALISDTLGGCYLATDDGVYRLDLTDSPELENLDSGRDPRVRCLGRIPESGELWGGGYQSSQDNIPVLGPIAAASWDETYDLKSRDEYQGVAALWSDVEFPDLGMVAAIQHEGREVRFLSRSDPSASFDKWTEVEEFPRAPFGDPLLWDTSQRTAYLASGGKLYRCQIYDEWKVSLPENIRAMAQNGLADAVIAVGDAGALWISRDGGKTWQ